VLSLRNRSSYTVVARRPAHDKGEVVQAAQVVLDSSTYWCPSFGMYAAMKLDEIAPGVDTPSGPAALLWFGEGKHCADGAICSNPRRCDPDTDVRAHECNQVGRSSVGASKVVRLGGSSHPYRGRNLLGKYPILASLKVWYTPAESINWQRVVNGRCRSGPYETRDPERYYLCSHSSSLSSWQEL
jgi:hypothetical protein